jgi:hypothetical protein
MPIAVSLCALRDSQSVKNFPVFYETGSLLHCPQLSATCLYPGQINPIRIDPSILFIKPVVIWPSLLRPGLPSGYFSSGSPIRNLFTCITNM